MVVVVEKGFLPPATAIHHRAEAPGYSTRNMGGLQTAGQSPPKVSKAMTDACANQQVPCETGGPQSKRLAIAAVWGQVRSKFAVTLKAHFDGKQIDLDEPFDLPAVSPLVITVMAREHSASADEWHRLASHALAAAYEANEPDYSVADVRG